MEWKNMWCAQCAVCRSLHQECRSNCVFAPHFPAGHPEKFALINYRLPASLIEKLLKAVDPSQREILVDSLVYEANAWLLDPVLGPRKFAILVERETEVLIQLVSLRQELIDLLTSMIQQVRQHRANLCQIAHIKQMFDSVTVTVTEREFDNGGQSGRQFPFHQMAAAAAANSPVSALGSLDNAARVTNSPRVATLKQEIMSLVLELSNLKKETSYMLQQVGPY